MTMDPPLTGTAERFRAEVQVVGGDVEDVALYDLITTRVPRSRRPSATDSACVADRSIHEPVVAGSSVVARDAVPASVGTATPPELRLRRLFATKWASGGDGILFRVTPAGIWSFSHF